MHTHRQTGSGLCWPLIKVFLQALTLYCDTLVTQIVSKDGKLSSARGSRLSDLQLSRLADKGRTLFGTARRRGKARAGVEHVRDSDACLVLHAKRSMTRDDVHH